MKLEKKLLLAALTLLFCALLPACAKKSAVEDDEAQVEDSTTTNVDLLTLKEKVETALNEDNHIWEASYNRRGDEAWVWIDGEQYCAGAIYPHDEWTPQDIVASFLNGSAPWVESWNWHDGDYLLWSNNYEHQFAVDCHINEVAFCWGNDWLYTDDWLYIDSYRTWPVKTPVGDISPSNLILLYQSGEWDGRELMYSEECPGLVVNGIDTDGRLVYYYDVRDMSEDAALATESMVRSWEDVYLAEYDEDQTECHAYVYPDLPASYDRHVWRFADTYRSYSDPKGTYVSFIERDTSKRWSSCIGARVELYKQGKMVQSWDLTPEKDFWGSSQSEMFFKEGECYFFHYDTLWHLLDDGNIELVMNDIVGCDFIMDNTVRAFYSQSGEVTFVPPLSEEELEILNQEG